VNHFQSIQGRYHVSALHGPVDLAGRRPKEEAVAQPVHHASSRGGRPQGPGSLDVWDLVPVCHDPRAGTLSQLGSAARVIPVRVGQHDGPQLLQPIAPLLQLGHDLTYVAGQSSVHHCQSVAPAQQVDVSAAQSFHQVHVRYELSHC
jgi:hypothetical protein